MVKSVYLVAQIWDSSGTSSGPHKNLMEDFENKSAVLRLHISLVIGEICKFIGEIQENQAKSKSEERLENWLKCWLCFSAYMKINRMEALQVQGNWEKPLSKSLPDH